MELNQHPCLFASPLAPLQTISSSQWKRKCPPREKWEGERERRERESEGEKETYLEGYIVQPAGRHKGSLEPGKRGGEPVSRRSVLLLDGG